MSFFHNRHLLMAAMDRLYAVQGDDVALTIQLVCRVLGGAGSTEAALFGVSIAASESDPTKLAAWNVSKFPDKAWDYKQSIYRIQMRWSTIFKTARKLGVEMTDKEVEKALMVLGEKFSLVPPNKQFKFQPVSAEEYYPKKHFGSCMCTEPSVAWYDDNPEKVQLMGIFKDDEYIGRFLLWTTDCGTKYVDRVYPSDGGSHSVAAREWAKENGYSFKEWDSRESEPREFKVTMDISNHGYPYMDTFKYARWEDGKVILNTDNNDYHRILTSTDSPEWSGPGCSCDRCNEDVDDEDDLVPVYVARDETEQWCSDCETEYATYIGAIGAYAADSCTVYLSGENEPYPDWYEYDRCDVDGLCYLTENLTRVDSGRLVHDRYAAHLTDGSVLAEDELQEEMVVFTNRGHERVGGLCEELGIPEHLTTRVYEDFQLNNLYWVDKIRDHYAEELREEVA